MNTDKAFNADVGVATTEIYRLQADFDHFPEEVKGIITNMFFNLGYDRCVLFILVVLNLVLCTKLNLHSEKFRYFFNPHSPSKQKS